MSNVTTRPRPTVAAGSVRGLSAVRPRAGLRALGLAAAIAVAGVSAAHAQAPTGALADPTWRDTPYTGGPGRKPEEAKPQVPDKIPPLSTGARLREFELDSPTRNRQAIDLDSIAIDEEVVVRFALVVTSPSGARNVSYEAIQCNRGERKLLAIGTPDGGWSPTPSSQWMSVRGERTSPLHSELMRALCSGRTATREQAEVVKRLAGGSRAPTMY